MEVKEVKTIPFAEFKVAADAAGTFEGRASTFGTIDSYGDRISPGAYKDTLPQFLERGFIGWGHDWTDPIGFVTEAEERTDGLWITGQFHGDTDAQKFRQRVKERVAADKFMGLSIGFIPEEWHYEDEGEVRVLDRIRLFEVSLVTVPAEANSQVFAVKGYGKSFEEHVEAFISQTEVSFRELIERCKAGSAERAKDGKGISEARKDAIDTVSESLTSMANQIAEQKEDPTPPEQATGEPAQPGEATNELAEIRARFLSESAYYGALEGDRASGITG